MQSTDAGFQICSYGKKKGLKIASGSNCVTSNEEEQITILLYCMFSPQYKINS